MPKIRRFRRKFTRHRSAGGRYTRIVERKLTSFFE
jgi:hypothetical protein